MPLRIARYLARLLPLLIGACPVAGHTDDGPAVMQRVPVPRIAIIIDDIGYQMELGRRAIALPGPVACAVLPATPRGRELARLAADAGKEVLLHLPLQAQNHTGDADPGALLLDMSRTQFAEAFAANLASVPHAVGVNNHRGSLLTRHPGHMSWLMEELRVHDGLFFVDSYTTHHSVALDVARETGVKAARRNVFLDNDPSADGLTRAFRRLLRLARRDGAAVGIGHPYPATLSFLEQMLPRLHAEGIELVDVSELVVN